MDIESIPRAVWLTRKSNSLLRSSKPLSVANQALVAMSRDPEVNSQSVVVASAFLGSLERRGLEHAPIPSVDADGDVVLTWVRGDLRGSAMITESGISSIVSQGRDIAYLSEEVPVTEKSIEESTFIALGGVGQGWQPNYLSSSMTWTLSGDRSSSPECERSILMSPAAGTRHSLNSQKEPTGDESSPSIGSKNLVWRHVTSTGF